MISGRLTLDVDSPFFRVQSKGLQRTLLTEPFRLVDIFVSSVVSGSGISLGVFVWTVQYRTLLGIETAGLDRKRTLHDTAQGIENSLGGKVLRGDEVDKVFLAFFFLRRQSGRGQDGCWRANLLQDIVDGGILFLQGARQ